LAVPPIIFVDRVDELTRLAHSNPAAVIELVRTLYAVSSPARGHDRLLLVVAGSDDDFLSRQDFEIERGRVRNPFWRSMNTHYSPFLGPEETYEFLERLGALAGLTFERAALEEAHRQTGGHKYVTRLLGTELCRDRNATPIDTGRLESAISAMVTRHNDYFSAILAHAPHETGDLLRQVAAAPSSHTELLQLGNSLPARAGGPLAALQFALNYRLIQLRDSRYELTMGLLGTWLNYTEGEAARRQPAAH
jgi:hypothetical protein